MLTNANLPHYKQFYHHVRAMLKEETMRTSMNLELQATQFLKKRGFKEYGEPYKTPSAKDQQEENAHILSSLVTSLRKKTTVEEIEITDIISGSFATRHVCFEELSISIDIDYKKNTKFDDTTYFEWRLYNLVVQWYLADGYGIYHYQFIPKKGVYFALYKLLEDEIEEYKENYFRVCEGRGMTRRCLSETRRLYGIGEESKYDMVPGKRYVIHAKKITGPKRKTLETMFAKYQKELKKYTVPKRNANAVHVKKC